MREETIQQRTRRHRNYMAGWNCNIDTFDPNTVQLHSLGEMNFRCVYCNALGFKSENQGTLSRPYFGILCCKKGETLLEPFPEPPIALLNLLQNQDVLSKHCRKNIRKFNSNLAMASIEYTDATVRQGPPGAFKIQGVMYRKLGPLLHHANRPPRCLQVYFFNSQN